MFLSFQLRHLADVNPATGQRKPVYSKAEAKAAKSLAIVVALFVISWIPLYTINSVMYFCPECPIPMPLLKFTIFLSHVNSMWNPALYAWGLSDFRAGLKKLFCFRKSTKADHIAGETSRKYSYAPSTISTGKDILWQKLDALPSTRVWNGQGLLSPLWNICYLFYIETNKNIINLMNIHWFNNREFMHTLTRIITHYS